MNHTEPVSEPKTEQLPESTTAEPVTQPPVEAQPSLEEQLAQAQAQAAEYLDNWRRAVAELSNARKRMQREMDEMRVSAAERVLLKLLPVVDDLERAFAALPAEQADSDWVSGFRLIQRKLEALLESEDVQRIPTEQTHFDPTLHHAVSHEEAEGYGDGQIISEVARGYRLGNKVLRPALVRVAKGT
ncbi:MAG: nucleotide exchange factor GrpE [Anaerolineae bacterium]